MERQENDPNETRLTNRMDLGTQGFDDFQAILLKKSRERSENQKRKIDLLVVKYEMENNNKHSQPFRYCENGLTK